MRLHTENYYAAIDSTEIPSGWYRICKINDAKRKRKLDLKLLGGVVQVLYSENSNPFIATFSDSKSPLPFTLKLCEQSPFLFAWFPVGPEPQFDLVPLSPLIRKGWSSPFHLEWKVKSNLLEIAENAADMGHFTSVHVYKEHALLSRFLTLGHKMTVAFHSARRILGIRVPIDIQLHYQGLGWVESTAKSPIVEVNVLYTPTPIDPKHLEIVLSLSFKKTRNPLFNLLLRLVLPWEAGRDYKRDIPIWENKTIHRHPKLCQADGPILKLRRWANQFYLSPKGPDQL